MVKKQLTLAEVESGEHGGVFDLAKDAPTLQREMAVYHAIAAAKKILPIGVTFEIRGPKPGVYASDYWSIAWYYISANPDNPLETTEKEELFVAPVEQPVEGEGHVTYARVKNGPT